MTDISQHKDLYNSLKFTDIEKIVKNVIILHKVGHDGIFKVFQG